MNATGPIFGNAFGAQHSQVATDYGWPALVTLICIPTCRYRVVFLTGPPLKVLSTKKLI